METKLTGIYSLGYSKKGKRVICYDASLDAVTIVDAITVAHQLRSKNLLVNSFGDVFDCNIVPWRDTVHPVYILYDYTEDRKKYFRTYDTATGKYQSVLASEFLAKYNKCFSTNTDEYSLYSTIQKKFDDDVVMFVSMSDFPNLFCGIPEMSIDFGNWNTWGPQAISIINDHLENISPRRIKVITRCPANPKANAAHKGNLGFIVAIAEEWIPTSVKSPTMSRAAILKNIDARFENWANNPKMTAFSDEMMTIINTRG
jgi:hypothetical protein